MSSELNHDQCYAAIIARDPRFDGVFFVGVSTTKIYCRPVCTARTPGRDRCHFYTSAAAAEAAGFRPCLRCRPELAPGQAPVDAVKRAARLAIAQIEQGAMDEGGVDSVAAVVGLSVRQLRRVVEDEYGVPPIAFAQTRRLLTAKQLLTETNLPITDIAFASGFASVRRFNHLFRSHYRLTPSALRRRNLTNDADAIVLKQAYRPPLAWSTLASFLVSRGAHGVESFDGLSYRRTVRLGKTSGWIAATPASGENVIRVTISHSLLPVLSPLLARVRHLFDLDANPQPIAAHLSRDERLSGHIRRTPGLRVPGALDGFELALRAILGQQVTVKAATTLYRRFVDKFGEPIETPFDGVDRLPPRAEEVAQASLQSVIDLGLTQRRAETVQRLARASAEGSLRLEPAVDLLSTMAALQDLPGIGPWTAHYIAMRALGDPDAFPEGDLGLLKALELSKPRELAAAAEGWRPWRAYGAMHLWHGLSVGG
jgi:AraC family transcriptional regulator of adaptative response / DNA-3-methyladenine glycosylase II